MFLGSMTTHLCPCPSALRQLMFKVMKDHSVIIWPQRPGTVWVGNMSLHEPMGSDLLGQLTNVFLIFGLSLKAVISSLRANGRVNIPKSVKTWISGPVWCDVITTEPSTPLCFFFSTSWENSACLLRLAVLKYLKSQTAALVASFRVKQPMQSLGATCSGGPDHV